MLDLIEQWLTGAFRSLLGSENAAGIQQALRAAENSQNLIISDFLRKYNSSDFDDLQRLRLAIFCDAPFQATFLYRISHQIFLQRPDDPLLSVLSYIMRSRTAIEVYYSAQIGSGFRIMHGSGIVIGPRHQIGSNFNIYQGVTLGQKRQNCPHEHIKVGNDCIFFAGAKIVGELQVGDSVILAANAVLLENAESHSTYAGIPARKVSSQK